MKWNLFGLAKDTLTYIAEKKYLSTLAKEKTNYHDWITSEEKKNLINLVESQVPYVVWKSKEGVLSKEALERIHLYFIEHPEVLVVYGDEDVISKDGERSCPWYKPDWSPDTYMDYYYIGGLVAVRRKVAEEVLGEKIVTLSRNENSMVELATVVIEYEETDHWYDDISSILIQVGGFRYHCQTIGHIPYILYHHWEENVIPLKKDSENSVEWIGKNPTNKNSLNENCNENNYTNFQRSDWVQSAMWKKYGAIPMNQSLLPQEVQVAKEQVENQVSIIIPSKDNPEILKQCLDSIIKFKDTSIKEIIVVDNGSTEQNKKKIETYLLERNHQLEIRYLYHPMEFNFSIMCNLGAESATGQIFLFLNDDVELGTQDCIRDMAYKAAQSFTGAVGLKLYYPGTKKIQHAGVSNIPIGPIHKLQFLQDNQIYYYGRNIANHNLLAVTGACLMVEKEKFYQVGGFFEGLKIAFNDIELCFKLHEKGYKNVVVNRKSAYHHESLSRGDDNDSMDKITRLMKERNFLYQLHEKMEGEDCFYPKQLNRDGLDCRIRPAYITCRNKPQPQSWEKCHLDNYKEDNCLMFRLDNCNLHKLSGYGVVIGDNNACYEKYILLKHKIDEETLEEKRNVYCMKTKEQYTPDLEENMEDQKNVGLSGFWIEQPFTNIPSGEYFVGMMARNRTGRLKLVNWSNRTIIV